MATTVTFNGASYSVPSYNDSGWAQGAGNLSSYLVAIASGTLQTTGGTFTLSAPVDFGATYGIKAVSFTTATASPATVGVLRLAAADVIAWSTSNYSLSQSSGVLNWATGATFATSSGAVGIATTPAAGYSLDVNGVARSKGVTNASNAAAGYLGEYIQATDSGNFAATSTFADAGSIALTAGDWDISVVAYCSFSGVTSTQVIIGIGTATGNSSAGIVYGDNAIKSTPLTMTDISLTIPSYRVSISSPTTYYCKKYAVYTVGTPSATTRISARRVR